MGMKKDKTRAYCPRCRHEQVFVRSKIYHGVHAFFTFVTLGLWGVCYAMIGIAQYFRPWRCEHCRWHKPEFRETSGGRVGVTVEVAPPRAA